MDGKFVPNRTIGLESLRNLPKATYEFHWMVFEPELWIEKIPGNNIHLVHIETIEPIERLEKIEKAIKKVGGRLGLAINPETDPNQIIPLIAKTKPVRVLIMTVHPGFSGQKYIYEMKDKIKRLRFLYPNLDIEVDGGVNLETGKHAYEAGANILAAASYLFTSPDIQDAIERLKQISK
jgi:ribulose-phosphate 3-epimerase